MNYSHAQDMERLPLSVIHAAQAVESILRYNEGYINKLCTRTPYDENGCPHVCLDKYMKRRLEIKLIQAIATMK